MTVTVSVSLPLVKKKCLESEQLSRKKRIQTPEVQNQTTLILVGVLYISQIISMLTVPIRILIRTTGIANALCYVYNYGYRLH